MSAAAEAAVSAATSVQAMRFARARAKEIAALAAGALARHAGGGRRTFQRLPRELRRRSMSHNAHRVPASHRARAAQDMADADPSAAAAAAEKEERTASDAAAKSQQKRRLPKAVVAPRLSAKHKKRRRTRRFWRRPAHVTAGLHARRERTGAWLAGTHVWHAKRFRMGARWGLRVALRRADKGLRASYRAAAYRCALHDSSFVRCVQLAGPRDALCAVLAAHAGPSSLCGVSAAAAVHRVAGRAGICVLFRAGQRPHGALCPAEFLWQPCGGGGGKEERCCCCRLWLWVHAAALQAVLAELARTAQSHPGVLVECRDKDLVRFDLVGPRATPLLCSVLRPLPPAGASEGQRLAASELWNTLMRQAPTSDALPIGSTFALTVTTPPRPPVVSVALRAPRARGSTTEGDSTAFARAVADWNARCAAFSVESSPLWTGVGDWSLQQEGEDDATAAPASKKAKTKGGIVNEKKKKKKKNTQGEPATLPLVLVQQPGTKTGPRRGFGAGWTVVAPARAAQTLWLALVHSGAHAVGLQEREWFEFERGAPVFPRDFPDTEAARDLAALEAGEAQARHNKKPKGKRPNFARLEVSSPFAPDWSLALGQNTDRLHVVRDDDELSRLLSLQTDEQEKSGALVMGHVSIIGRGHPTACALICVPEDGDKELCQQRTSESGPCIQLQRTIAGFATTASFSFAHGAGEAIAFCALSRISEQLRTASSRAKKGSPTIAQVLVRNPTSAKYFLATFRPFTETKV